MKTRILLALLVLPFSNFSQSINWVDSMDVFAQTEFLPANKYHWTWVNASLLNTIKVQCEQSSGEKKKGYLEYIRKAMDSKRIRANGKRPNAVASGLGMAYLARVTGEEKYKAIADKIFDDYKNIPRAPNKGVTHLRRYRELWDDTVFMIGVFLREMYLLTGDEKYLTELVVQFEAHREKLKDEKWGLWYHGWDSDTKRNCNLICGQKGWSDNPMKRSSEIWGRGNGWVIVTLAETIRVLPKTHPQRTKLSAYLKEMIVNLPSLQDAETGHWFQLPIRKDESGNFIESSSTAMFAYGILTALEEEIVEGKIYEACIDLAYHGLKKYSTLIVPGGLTTKNVCKGTCIGDKDYYFNRKVTNGKAYGLAMFILFGRSYHIYRQTKN